MMQRSCSIINPLLIAIYVLDMNGDFFYHLLLMVLLGEQNHIHGIFIRLILAQFKRFYDLCKYANFCCTFMVVMTKIRNITKIRQ